MLAILWVATALSAVPDDVAMKMRLRDGWGGCEAVWALGSADEVREALVTQTTLARPPWIPMRAATCLATRAEDEKTRPILISWVGDPAVPGLAKVTLGVLDRFPEAEARATLELASTLDVPLLRGDVRRAMATSIHPAVRAMSPAP